MKSRQNRVFIKIFASEHELRLGRVLKSSVAVHNIEGFSDSTCVLHLQSGHIPTSLQPHQSFPSDNISIRLPISFPQYFRQEFLQFFSIYR